MAEINVTLKIPNWSFVEDAGSIQFLVIDPDVVYPLVLGLLKQEPDRYWLEVARRCLTAALLDAGGHGINVRILNRPQWALDKHPNGDGAEAGAAEFRRHYETIKGALLK